MLEKLKIQESDNILVLAPHPDDECIGAGGILINYPNITDIIIVTDGCKGTKIRSMEEEKVLRKEQFDKEMKLVKPNNTYYLGFEDNGPTDLKGCLDDIDLKKYTKIFMPWTDDFHPDHKKVAYEILRIRNDKLNPNVEIYSYEINNTLNIPTHFMDVTDIIDKKMELIRCHKDQVENNMGDELIKTINKFRALQEKQNGKYYEAYQLIPK